MLKSFDSTLSQNLGAFWPEDSLRFSSFLNWVRPRAPEKVMRLYTVGLWALQLAPWFTFVSWRVFSDLSEDRKAQVLGRLQQGPYLFRMLFFFLRSASFVARQHDSSQNQIPLTPTVRTSNPDAEFIVVGSGAAGGAIACALTRQGRRVLVVEEGREPGDLGWHSPLPELQANVFRDWGFQVTRGKIKVPLLQACTVGGTCVINGRILHRLPESWREKHHFPYCRQTEDKLFEELGGEVSQTESGEILSTIHSLDWQATPMTRARQRPDIFLTRARENGAHLRSGSRVIKILRDGRRAVGVILESGEKLYAECGVILAAGALHTPAILAQSEVKLPKLGRDFSAHLSVSVSGVKSGGDPELELSALAHRGIKIASQSGPWELMLSRQMSLGTKLRKQYEERGLWGSWMATVIPAKTGRLFFSRGRVQAHLNLCQADAENIRTALLKISYLMLRHGYRQVTPGLSRSFVPMESPSDISRLAELPARLKHYFLGAGHLFGGAVWGASAEEGVVGPDFQVFGFERLWVADASTLPGPTGINPLLTIQTTAYRLGSEIAIKH